MIPSMISFSMSTETVLDVPMPTETVLEDDSKRWANTTVMDESSGRWSECDENVSQNRHDSAPSQPTRNRVTRSGVRECLYATPPLIAMPEHGIAEPSRWANASPLSPWKP